MRGSFSTPFALVWCAAMAWAEPAPPSAGPDLVYLQPGVFCAFQPMDQSPAPGTRSGWLHVPAEDVTFHWPDRQVVPAALGLAFGLWVQMAPGKPVPYGEMRVYRPGDGLPDVWGHNFSDMGRTLAFFRFDTEAELIPGIWRFEGWDGASQLFQVEFEVVTAEALPDIAGACGAVS